MVKKTKGKKGRDDDGKRGEDQQGRGEKVSEVDKEWFQIQIRSLEEKLSRRNDKMTALEISNKDFQERYALNY